VKKPFRQQLKIISVVKIFCSFIGGNTTYSEKWKYDDVRKQYLENLGYCVTILWESDLKDQKRKGI